MVRSYYQQDDEPYRPALHGDTGEDAERSKTEPGHAGERDRHPHGRTDQDARRAAIDHYECSGEGAKAASQYVTDHDMEPRKQLLSTLPDAYTAARATVLQARDAAAKDIKAVRESLDCHLDESIRARFRQAWDRVHGRVKRCTGTPRLCPGEHDCEFPFNPDEDTRTLTVHKVHYTERVEQAENQFDALAGEPAALAKRGTDLTKEVDDLKTLSAQETPAYEAAYAALIAAEYHSAIDVILGGIDTANDYEDYLLSCFDCSRKGRDVLMTIVGILAARACREEKRHARCEDLKTKLAAEIIAEAHDLERE